MVANTAYVASRAKSRRKKLADLARMRQLINQSTDQLTASVSNMGYADDSSVVRWRQQWAWESGLGLGV